VSAVIGARAALALLIAGVSSTLVLVSLPVFVGAMANAFGAGEREVGWLAAADMAGSAVASLGIIPLLGRVRWRRAAALGVAAMIAGNALSMLATTLPAVLGARLLAGAGGGIMLSLSFVGLCRSTSPDRYFAIYVFAQLTLQVLALAGFPPLLAALGLDAIFGLLAAVAAATLALVPLFPRGLHESSSTAPGPSAGGIGLAKPTSAAALALAAQAVYFVAPGAAWGYFERIGNSFGLTLAQVGTALGLSTFAGMAGALLVVLVGARMPRWPAMLAGSGISMLALVLLLEGNGLPRFLVAAALFNFAWNATFPYQMGVLAALDRDGSVAVLSLLMQVGGLALGPMLGSMLRPEEGYALLLYGCIGCYAASLGLFRIAGRVRG
jgi:predicted MFS family arabinose efflux permease